jgi:hypothetical protein
MGNKLYLEAVQRATERQAKKDEARARKAQKITDTSTASASLVQLLQPMDQSTVALNTPVESQRSAVKAAPARKTCSCHKDQNRPMDSHGCCKATIDGIRFSSRMPADVDTDDVARVQAIIDSGVIKRAKTKAELIEQREQRGTASAMKEVANATNKPVAIQPKPDLPDGVNFFDPNQAHYFAKCAVLRGLNFQLAAKDCYPLLSPLEHLVVAAAAEKDPNIRTAIEQEASQRGLGDSDKNVYVALLWKHALSTRPQDYQDRGTAMRILGRVFLPENGAQQQKPATLVIEGISDGLARMGLAGPEFEKAMAKIQSTPVTIPDLNDKDFAEDEQ